MAIKRLTIDLDDAPDRGPRTAVPQGLQRTGTEELKDRQLTKGPPDSETDETVSPSSGKVVPRAPGRTWGDLVAEFQNQPRAMATLLMFISIVPFVAKISKPGDLLVPFIIGSGLNAIWFLVGRFTRPQRDLDT